MGLTLGRARRLGVAYTYEIDREAVFQLLTSETASIAQRVLALHMVVVHLADATMARRILEYFFCEDSDKLHPRLLKVCDSSERLRNLSLSTHTLLVVCPRVSGSLSLSVF